MEFAALIKFWFALLLCLWSAGCASSPPPSPAEVEAFQGKPMPENVRQKMRASQTAVPVETPMR